METGEKNKNYYYYYYYKNIKTGYLDLINLYQLSLLVRLSLYFTLESYCDRKGNLRQIRSDQISYRILIQFILLI